MRAEQRGRGVIIYEKEPEDYVQEAVVEMARMNAKALTDEKAARVGALFAEWKSGVSYTVGERVSDGNGTLYRVVQSHTSQADWPMEQVPALYAPLGENV